MCDQRGFEECKWSQATPAAPNTPIRGLERAPMRLPGQRSQTLQRLQMLPLLSSFANWGCNWGPVVHGCACTCRVRPESPPFSLFVLHLMRRSRLADYTENCRVSAHATSTCPNQDNHQACLSSYARLIGQWSRNPPWKGGKGGEQPFSHTSLTRNVCRFGSTLVIMEPIKCESFMIFFSWGGGQEAGAPPCSIRA